MKSVFRKLGARNIKGNIRLFLSVISIVLLATMLLSGFITNSARLSKAVETYFSDTNLADMWIYTDKVQSQDENFFDSLNVDYTKRFYYETSAEVVGQNVQTNAKIYVGTSNAKYAVISEPIYDGKEGCLIDVHFADNNKIRLYENDIKFSISYGAYQFDFQTRITGKMSFDECADTYSSVPIFIDEKVFLNLLNDAFKEKVGIENYFAEVPFNQILIKTDNFNEIQNKVKQYYETSSSKLYLIASRDMIESVVLLNDEVSQSKKMIYVFPVIFLIVSILVILTTIDQLIVQERQKIGTLKSIGIPDKKILWHYSSYGAILCGIGGVLGTIFGTILIPLIMFIKYKLVYSIPDDYIRIQIPIWWLILVVAGVVLLGFLVSLFASKNIITKKPIECLRFEISSSAKKLKKNSGKFKKVPLSIKMAVRNLKLKPIRAIMVSIGIAGCVALLLCGFGITDTLNHSVDNDLKHLFHYDITTTYASHDFETKLNDLEGLNEFELYEKFYTEVNFDSKVKNMNVYRIQKDSKLSEIKLKENETWISSIKAEELGVNVGDKVIVSADGLENELEINKIFETSLLNGIYTSKELNLPSTVLTKGAWILCGEATEAKVDFVNKINGTGTANSIQGLYESVDSKISSISLMTNTLKTFAILLAVVVLLNLVFLIIKERTREIATLKVLGQGIWTIASSIVYEILAMAIFGTAIGLCLGFPLLKLVLMINKVEVVTFLYHINVLSYFMSIGIIFVTIFIVCLGSLYKIHKLDMIGSLKSVE